MPKLNHLSEFLKHKSEQCHKVANTSQEIPGETNALTSARSFLFKNYIKTVIESPSGRPDVRVLFVSDRARSDFRNPISFEANGAVFAYNLESGAFKQLVYPHKNFNTQNLSKKAITKNIDAKSYSIYKLDDGTVANMYFWDGEWRFSTNKAYDAGDMHFCNGHTYKEVIETCITKNHDLNLEDLCRSMDPVNTYIVRFKYLPYHCTASDYEFKFIGCYETCSGKQVELDMLKETLVESSADEWVNSMSKGSLSKCIWQLIESKNSCKGIILREKKQGSLGEYSNILLEGSMYKNIRKCLYNLTYMAKMGVTLRDIECIEKFRAVYNYLNERNRPVYINLVPNSAKFFDKVKHLLSAVCDVLMGMPLLPEYEHVSTKINNFAEEVKSNMGKDQIPQSREIILDYVTNQKYTMQVYTIILSLEG